MGGHAQGFPRVSLSLWFDLQFCWHSEELDQQMEFVMTVVRTIRSLRADYNLTKTRPDCKCFAPDTKDSLGFTLLLKQRETKCKTL